MVVDISLLKHEKCHRRGRTICFSCWFRGRMFCWLNSNHRDESMTIARLNDITFWSIYPRVRCLNGESVSYWCDSFLYFSSFCLILILFVFSLFLFFLWRILILVLTSMFAASVQRDGRHPPDEAFGLGQHQQPVDVEQWRRKQLVQRSRTGWSTAPPQDRHRGISQRTSSPLARKQQQQPQLEERPDQTIL